MYRLSPGKINAMASSASAACPGGLPLAPVWYGLPELSLHARASASKGSHDLVNNIYIYSVVLNSCQCVAKKIALFDLTIVVANS